MRFSAKDEGDKQQPPVSRNIADGIGPHAEKNLPAFGRITAQPRKIKPSPSVPEAAIEPASISGISEVFSDSIAQK